ncbi:hypothetical protein BG004_005356 [Podila humilis]|nr:hypothetical protein BG004_005356 [Podila humilis]
MPSTHTRSQWDHIPSETLINICLFLSTLDLLNMCSAYPTLQPLVLSSPTLWRDVYLPFPDPLLFNYPGWRAERSTGSRSKLSDSLRSSYSASSISSSDASSSTTGTSVSSLLSSSQGSPYVYPLDASQEYQRETIPSSHRQGSRKGSQVSILHDGRHRLLSEPDYYNLPDIDGGENDEEEDNTGWVILDVLDRVPLRFIQHLSFGTPPCHLCTYPCTRICYCECHQNEQSRSLFHQDTKSSGMSSSNSSSTEYGEEHQSSALSRPLQGFLEYGLVDFSQHIDLHSLSYALASTSQAGASGDALGLGNTSHRVMQSSADFPPTLSGNRGHVGHEPIPEERRPSRDSELDQLDLPEVLLQWSLLDEERTHEREEIDSRSLESTISDENLELTEEEDMEISRQQAETRAAYQRARLLIRILASGELEALETLRVPWWPATRIYTIRQQLERWSYKIEQAIASNTVNNNSNFEKDAAEGFSRDKQHLNGMHQPRETDNGHDDFCLTFVPWRTRWTNCIKDEDVKEEANEENEGKEELTVVEEEEETQDARGLRSAGGMRYPLANLTRFSLRSGGEVVSHERHCLGTSALILSGRSSSVNPSSLNSSVPGSPPSALQSTFASTSASPSAPVSIPGSPPEYVASAASFTALPFSDPEPRTPATYNGRQSEPIGESTFRYCQHCGSQYLASSSKSSLLDSNSSFRPGRSLQPLLRNEFSCFCQVS